MQVPNLCMQNCAILQSSPELQKLFGEGDPEASDALMIPPVPGMKPPSRGLPGVSPARPTGAAKTAGMDTPRGFEEELTEEELLKRDLEKVKREREVLMNSIMAARDQAGAYRSEWS